MTDVSRETDPEVAESLRLLDLIVKSARGPLLVEVRQLRQALAAAEAERDEAFTKGFEQVRRRCIAAEDRLAAVEKLHYARGRNILGQPVDGRNAACVEQWPDCRQNAYDPSCCRFPKSCSCGPVPDAERGPVTSTPEAATEATEAIAAVALDELSSWDELAEAMGAELVNHEQGCSGEYETTMEWPDGRVARSGDVLQIVPSYPTVAASGLQRATEQQQ